MQQSYFIKLEDIEDTRIRGQPNDTQYRFQLKMEQIVCILAIRLHDNSVLEA